MMFKNPRDLVDILRDSQPQGSKGGLLLNDAANEIENLRKNRTINCDQVAWILGAIERYLPCNEKPAISRQGEMKKYGLLYEIMEAANLLFEDERARHNATPQDVRNESIFLICNSKKLNNNEEIYQEKYCPENDTQIRK